MPDPVPGALRVAAALVGVESAAAFAAGVGFVVAALAGRPHDRGTTALLGAVLAILGAGTGLVARGLWRSHPRARTPAYLVQFFAIVIGVGQLHTLAAEMVPLLALAAATVLALSSGRARAALSGQSSASNP